MRRYEKRQLLYILYRNRSGYIYIIYSENTRNILNVSLKNREPERKAEAKILTGWSRIRITDTGYICVCHVSFVMQKKKISTYRRLDQRHENIRQDGSRKKKKKWEAVLFFYFIRDNIFHFSISRLLFFHPSHQNIFSHYCKRELFFIEYGEKISFFFLRKICIIFWSNNRSCSLRSSLFVLKFEVVPPTRV